MWNELVSHLCEVVKNQEKYLSYRGPSWGACSSSLTPGSQPRVLVLGREVSITSGCEKQGQWWLSERERDFRVPGVPLKGPTHWLRLTLSSSIGAAALKEPRIYGEELNYLTSGWELEEQLSCTQKWSTGRVHCSFLSPPPTELAGRCYIWVSISLANTVCPTLMIPWDIMPQTRRTIQAISSGFSIQTALLGSSCQLS